MRRFEPVKRGQCDCRPAFLAVVPRMAGVCQQSVGVP